MSEEENKEIIRRLHEAYNTGDSDVIRALFDRKCIAHGPGGNLQQWDDAAEGHVRMVRGLRRIMPDGHYATEDLLADGDKVVVRSTVVATPSGGDSPTGWGVTLPATDKQVTWVEICIYRLADGRVIEYWYEMDWANILLQRGVVPGKTVV